MDSLLFLIFAFTSVAFGVSVITNKQPIGSALSLVGVMGSLAVLYLLLGAEFIAAAQMIVYAGAIMVLFIFVIMLLNAGAETRGTGKLRFAKWIGIPLFAVFIGLLCTLILRRVPDSTPVTFGSFDKAGGLEIGRALFTEYLLPFEVTSILILIAILGAVVLARKEI